MNINSNAPREGQPFIVETEFQDFFDLSTIDRLIRKQERFLLKSADGSKKIIDSIVRFKPDTENSCNECMLLCRGHYTNAAVKKDPVYYCFKLFVNLKRKTLRAVLLSPVKIVERKTLV